VHINIDEVAVLEDRLSIRHNRNNCVKDESYELAKVNCKRKAGDDIASKANKIVRNE